VLLRNAERGDKFGAKDEVVESRIHYTNENLPNLLGFYQRFYNNVCEIDMKRSKWFVEDRALHEIKDNL